jgi:hypothetical protein
LKLPTNTDDGLDGKTQPLHVARHDESAVYKALLGYLSALGVPVVLLLCGALSKKLVRGSSWIRNDFFLGVELSLTALGSGLGYIAEITRSSRITNFQEKGAVASVYCVTCFFLLFIVMSMHQDWEKRPQNINGQVIWLGLICNFIGISLVSSFVLLVKGTS